MTKRSYNESLIAEIEMLYNINCSLIDSNDCKHFDLKCPEFSTAAEIKEELEDTSGVFSLFDEFHRGLQDMSQQEWITFRSKYYQLEEYLAQWYEKLKAQEQSPISNKLKKEIDKFKVCSFMIVGTMVFLCRRCAILDNCMQ